MRTVFRKEIKYVISRVEFLRLTKHLDVLMQRDTNGVNGTYIVRSQYYDSLGDRDLYDNLDGVMEKRKIRVRIYSPDDQYAKLEYKCKSNTDGKKYSLTITREEALLMEKRKYGFLLDYEEPLAKTLYVKLMQGGYIIDIQRITGQPVDRRGAACQDIVCEIDAGRLYAEDNRGVQEDCLYAHGQ